MPTRAAKRPAPISPSHSDAARIAVPLLIAAAILASWFAVDPRSIDSFEAPKIVLVATALAAAAVAAWGGHIRREGFALSRPTLPAALLLAGLAGAAISALSPGRGQAREALLGAAPLLLAIPLGAGLAYARRRRAMAVVFAGSGALTGLLVMLAAAKVYSPVDVRGYSNRAGLGALVGNAGYAGIALALAAVALAPFAAGKGRGRAAALAAGALTLAGVFATLSLSAIVVAAAGIASFAYLAGGRRSRAALAGILALALAASAAYAPVRRRGTSFLRAARHGEWNAAFTARAAPWLAATEMIRAHPWVGVGVDRFRSEYVPARLAAEARIRRRLVLSGMPTNSFAQAHNDYLDLVAAVGIPAAACLITAYALLLGAAWRRARGHPELAGSAATLVAGAVAAFTWFPFQIVPAALWLLLQAGNAHRLLREGAP
jgi:O-antigen ligase